MKEDDISEEKAVEFMEYNVVNSYAGRSTPIFVRDHYDLETIEEIYGRKNKKEGGVR